VKLKEYRERLLQDPEVAAIYEEMRKQNPHGDYCGNCQKPWPCYCDDPVQCCGICASAMSECQCTERDMEVSSQ